VFDDEDGDVVVCRVAADQDIEERLDELFRGEMRRGEPRRHLVYSA
jgi:hypothetical protein